MNTFANSHTNAIDVVCVSSLWKNTRSSTSLDFLTGCEKNTTSVNRPLVGAVLLVSGVRVPGRVLLRETLRSGDIGLAKLCC